MIAQDIIYETQFKRWLQDLYGNGTLELDYKSCEMLSEDLYAQINARYPGRAVEITGVKMVRMVPQSHGSHN